MDTHLLLRGEGSGRLRDRLPAFKRRSDAIAYGSSYQKAAALVDLVCSSLSLSRSYIMTSHVYIDLDVSYVLLV